MEIKKRHYVKCLKCGYEWVTKVDRPVRCQNVHCQCFKWDKPRNLPKVEVKPQATETPLITPTMAIAVYTPVTQPIELPPPKITPTEPVMPPPPVEPPPAPAITPPIDRVYVDNEYRRPPSIITYNPDIDNTLNRLYRRWHKVSV